MGDSGAGSEWLRVSITASAPYKTALMGGLGAGKGAAGWTGTAPTWGDGRLRADGNVVDLHSYLCGPKTAGTRD